MSDFPTSRSAEIAEELLFKLEESQDTDVDVSLPSSVRSSADNLIDIPLTPHHGSAYSDFDVSLASEKSAVSDMLSACNPVDEDIVSLNQIVKPCSQIDARFAMVSAQGRARNPECNDSIHCRSGY